MRSPFPSKSRLVVPRLALLLAAAPCFSFLLQAQAPDNPQAPSVKISAEPGPPKRIPREQALTTAALDGTVREQAPRSAARPIAAARLLLRNTQTNQQTQAITSGDGVFRIFPLPPGSYELRVEANGYSTLSIPTLSLNANEVLTLEIFLTLSASSEMHSRLPRQSELGPPLPAETALPTGNCREFRHRLDADPNYILEPSPDVLPPAADVFSTMPNRWELPQPNYRRYVSQNGSLYAKPRWYDPFNHNRFKGDEPIWPEVFGQQVFLDFTGSAETFLEGRRVPTPSGVSAAQPGSADFFGKGDQFFLAQTLRFRFS